MIWTRRLTKTSQRLERNLSISEGVETVMTLVFSDLKNKLLRKNTFCIQRNWYGNLNDIEVGSIIKYKNYARKTTFKVLPGRSTCFIYGKI